MMDRPKHLDEICENCGLTLGSHCGSSYYSDHYKMHIPLNYCPGDEGRMNWGKGPGTVFKSATIHPTDKLKEDSLDIKQTGT